MLEKLEGKIWNIGIQLLFIPYYVDHNKEKVDKRIKFWNSFCYKYLMTEETKKYFNSFGYFG